MKFIASLIAIATLIGAAAYMAVSLNRWEWNRALFFGLIVLITEVAIATALILRRIARLERHNAEETVRVILRETRASPNRFAWLEKSTGQFSVFITFFVGGGVILSGVAWMLDRIASATSTPARERQLARQLASISYPSESLVVDDVTVLAQEVPGADDVQIRKLLRRAGHGS